LIPPNFFTKNMKKERKREVSEEGRMRVMREERRGKSEE
jgi:hypothetical protein